MPDLPGESRYWVLCPTKPDATPFVFQGYYFPAMHQIEPGLLEDGQKKPFVFTDIAQTASRRRRFGEGLGVITAIFRKKPTQDSDGKAGPLLGAVHIRCVDEASFRGKAAVDPVR
jgi:hypothetical protein